MRLSQRRNTYQHSSICASHESLRAGTIPKCRAADRSTFGLVRLALRGNVNERIAAIVWPMRRATQTTALYQSQRTEMKRLLSTLNSFCKDLQGYAMRKSVSSESFLGFRDALYKVLLMQFQRRMENLWFNSYGWRDALAWENKWILTAHVSARSLSAIMSCVTVLAMY